MDLKLAQELKLTQRLSPLQIQTIKLLELPLQELQQRIRKELEENPALDEESAEENALEDGEPKKVSLSEYDSDNDTIPSYKLYANNRGRDELPEYNTFSVKESFTQSLMEQLGYKSLNEKQKAIATFLIGSIDSDGYLRRDVETLADDMAFRASINATPEEVTEMLALIQEFEPTGVGARDLRECLLLQMRNAGHSETDEIARRILGNCFSDFSAKRFQKIMQKLGIDSKQMKAATARILKLNPSPGGQIDDTYIEQAQQIVPDFKLEFDNEELKLSMPRFNVPELRVNRKYADILNGVSDNSGREMKEAAAFVKQKLDSAKWFVEALKQRHNTLMKTMQAILDYQRDYFTDGDEANLKPMVLKDIAAITGFDISTISRVVNSKYIETHFGIYPLKYFFSEGMENVEGDQISTRELKKALQELVGGEDKSKPLTDDELVKLMANQGYKLARRTIAKYRDQLGIPKARLRKELL